VRPERSRDRRHGKIAALFNSSDVRRCAAASHALVRHAERLID